MGAESSLFLSIPGIQLKCRLYVYHIFKVLSKQFICRAPSMFSVNKPLKLQSQFLRGISVRSGFYVKRVIKKCRQIRVLGKRSNSLYLMDSGPAKFSGQRFPFKFKGEIYWYNYVANEVPL